MKIEAFPQPDWEPLPCDGCVNVEGRVVLRDEALGLAPVRFGEHGTIQEHPGANDTVVFCLEGSAWASVGEESGEIRAGEGVFRPVGVRHRLWMEAATMTTLMCERPAS